MSEGARDLTLERVRRLTEAVADLTESHAAQGKAMLKLLNSMDDRLRAMDAKLDSKLSAIEKSLHELASEQILLGNRVENAFARALRANIRLDDIEDTQGDG